MQPFATEHHIGLAVCVHPESTVERGLRGRQIGGVSHRSVGPFGLVAHEDVAGASWNDVATNGVYFYLLVGESCEIIVFPLIGMQFGSPDGRPFTHPRVGIGACHLIGSCPAVQVVAGPQSSARSSHVILLCFRVCQYTRVAQVDAVAMNGANLLSRPTRLLLLLVNAHIVNLVSHRHCLVVYFPTVVAPDGEVEQQVLRSCEGVDVLTDASVYRLAQRNVVQQFVIQINPDVARSPVHPPDMELVGPCGIFLSKMAEGDAFGVPYGIVAPVVAPRSIGQNVGDAIDAIELHHIYFTARRPFHVFPQQPDGRPRTAGGGYLGTHLEPPVEEAEAVASGQRSRSVAERLALPAPVGGTFLIGGILAFVGSCLDDEASTLLAGILALIPLRLVVAHKATFGLPNGRVGQSVSVELVAPDEFPSALGVDGQGKKRQKDAKSESLFHEVSYVVCQVFPLLWRF